MALTETIIAYSDCLDVRPIQEETYLIEYSNETDYAGIVYTEGSPILQMRVHAKFFKERSPEENESSDSTDSVDKLSSVTKDQRLLQVEPAPYYFHKKLKRVLQHNYISIDGSEWEKEENYEQNDLNEEYPMATAEVWLTEKNSTDINIYGTVTP